MKKRIAILGAGFAGLAACWHLLQAFPDAEINLFDPQEISGRASGLSSGLLHPYSGMHAKRSLYATEGMEASQELLGVASAALGKSVIASKGILRLPMTADQEAAFEQRAKQFDDIEWWSEEECRERIPGITCGPGMYIKRGMRIDAGAYLQGLLSACQQAGARFEKRALDYAEAQKEYEIVILATGAGASSMLNLRIEPVKGQILQLAWPENLPPPPCSLSAKKYLVMIDDNRSCLVGATFEHHYSTTSPTPDTAMKEILPEIGKIYPQLLSAKVLNCFAGLRASSSNHMPLVQRIEERCWIFTGLGSKGLLYHALYAKNLASELLRSFS